MKPDNYPTSPTHLWDHFYQFTQIPRPSKQETAIRQYLIDLANELGHPWKVDAVGNLVIYVPGTHGLEQRPPVVIQNHVDMVTVKTDDKVHDFSQDSLQLQVEAGWLKADRTTLGADNGLGCAAALALMTDKTVAHPPLELLFTMDEETGLGGALNLDAALLSGKRMLNLDTEDWGEVFIGCAGGRGWEMTRQFDRESLPEEHEGFQLVLSGLAGGHSGIQIHQQLGCAIKLLAEWLSEAAALGVRLAGFESGVAHNVIARQARVVFSCHDDVISELDCLNVRLLARWKSYLPDADQSVQLDLQPIMIDTVLSQSAQQQLQQLLSIFPHGAQRYNSSQPADLVDLSINLAVVKLDENQLYLESSLRYFNEGEASPLIRSVLSIAEVFKLSTQEILNYPGWVPEFNNPLLAQVKTLHQELFGAEPAVKAIHAGLECGVLKSKMGEVDIISFGPTIKGAHSPSERLDIATVTPFWTLLTALLKQM
jgi:dipeptidase D